MATQLESILDHLVPALLVIFRIGGIAIVGPVLGSSLVPVRVRVFLCLVFGLAIYPALGPAAAAHLPEQLNLWALVPLVATEITLGAIIGFLASMPLVAAQTGGLVMGQQMGLGFARFYNPAIDDEADVIGQMLFLGTLAGFLLVNGHEQIFLALLHSFDHLPLGGLTLGPDLIALLTGALTSAFEVALRVAAPLLALIFLETVAMGFVAKTVPQLNILSLGFPIRILAGVAIVALGLIVIDEVLMESVNDVLEVIHAWVESP